MQDMCVYVFVDKPLGQLEESSEPSRGTIDGDRGWK
jgi:hypothetical protein